MSEIGNSNQSARSRKSRKDPEADPAKATGATVSAAIDPAIKSDSQSGDEPAVEPDVEPAEIVEKATVESPPMNSNVQIGKIVVRSGLYKLAPDLVKDEEIEVELFVTSVATVSASAKAIMKDAAGYPVAHVEGFVSWPCYREEAVKALEVVRKVVNREVRAEVLRLRGKTKPKDDADADRGQEGSDPSEGKPVGRGGGGRGGSGGSSGYPRGGRSLPARGRDEEA